MGVPRSGCGVVIKAVDRRRSSQVLRCKPNSRDVNWRRGLHEQIGLCEVPTAAECNPTQLFAHTRSRKHFKGWRAGKVQAAAVEPGNSDFWTFCEGGLWRRQRLGKECYAPQG